MLEQNALTICDEPDEVRASLVQALRRHDYPVITEAGDLSEQDGTRRIFLKFPSDLALLATITDYVMKRVRLIWSQSADDFAALNIALSEALINAVEHGNHSDRSKLVRFAIEINEDEARFTVEDEGDGFKVDDVPHPSDPENLLKSSGRGVLMIKTIMDEAQYDNDGKRLTMIKRPTGI